jgi:hypothetical protein
VLVSRDAGAGAGAAAGAAAAPGHVASSGVASRVRRGLVAALLVLISAGYLAVAADQSHDVPAVRHLRAEQAGLVSGTPSAVQQALYRVPVPSQARGAAYFEANSWAQDTLYVQFATTRAGLAAFLGQLGAGPAGLRPGFLAAQVPAAQAAQVPWRFPPGHHWAGVALTSAGPGPSHAITVNLDDPQRPVVFVAAAIGFAPGASSRTA